MYTRLSVLIVLLQCLLENITCEELLGKKEPQLSGLFAPVFTPINDLGALNLSIIPEYAKHIKKSGLDGVVVAGIGGEVYNLGISEKKKLIDAWVSAGKPLGIKIIAQIGGIPIPDILELAKHAVTVKVDGVLILPSLTPIPITPELFANAIENLSKVTKSLPIIYDDEISDAINHEYITEYFKKASEKVPQFKGMKIRLSYAVLIKAATKIRKDQELFILNDEAIASGTLLGFDSFIAPAVSLFPELVKKIIASVKSADLHAARKYQEKLTKLTEFIKSQGTDYVTPFKVTFQIITGIKVGPTRSPLKPIPQKEITAIKSILRDEGIKIAK